MGEWERRKQGNECYIWSPQMEGRFAVVGTLPRTHTAQQRRRHSIWTLCLWENGYVHVYVLVRWIIIRGQAWVSMHLLIWCFVMAHKLWITAGFVTVCCSMSMVSKTLCSHFSGQGSYYGYTHAWTKFQSWAESLALMSLCMVLTCSKRTQLLCVIRWYRLWAVLPLSVMPQSSR